MVTEIHNDKDMDRYITEKKGSVLLACQASWCRQCKAMIKTVEGASSEFQDRLSFYSIDIDEMEGLSSSLHLEGVPTYIIFNDGIETASIIGYQKKETFSRKINEILATCCQKSL